MTKVSSRKVWVLGLVLAVAFGLRLGAAAWWQSRHPGGFTFGDSESYWVLGRAIYRGEPYQYGSPDAKVFRTPGYPLVLAAMFQVVGREPDFVWARGMGAALGTVTVAGVYVFGRQLFDQRTGLVACGLAAIYPGAIATSIFILSEAAFCPLMIAQLVAWTFSTQSESPRRRIAWAATAGAVAGAATLVRPSWLLFTPLAVVAATVIGRDHRAQLVRGCSMLAVMAMVMTPWWVRNYRVTGHFVPTTLQVGASLYDGLNPAATGSSDMSFVAEFAAEENADNDNAAAPLEYRLDRRIQEAALIWAREHPLEVLRLAAIKFMRMWNIWPNDEAFRGLATRLVVACTYVPILVAGLFGIWRFAAWRWPYVLCWLPAVYMTVLHMVFVSSIRYREPAMLGLIVLAAATLNFGSRTRGTDAAT